jgi:RHS repeat-associated protein
METSFPHLHFLRLGEKISQVTEARGVGQKTARIHIDANGNLTNDGNGKTYGWDAANQMVSITQASGVTGFAYDGFGRRVQETFNGALIKQWVWGGAAQPEEERDASNNVTKRFYRMGEQIGGSNYYFSFDHLNSVREMTNSAGGLVARYDYDPYGRRTLASGTDLADFGFQAMYYHAASGLNLTWFRAYDANLGRWLSRDPIGEDGGINLYAYVLNNPVNANDPFGLTAWGAGAGAAIGGWIGWAVGGAIGGAGGAAGGTLVAPGVGTVGGGAVGATEGSVAGAAIGVGVGAWIGDLISNMAGGERKIQGKDPNPWKGYRPKDPKCPNKGGTKQDPQTGKWKPVPRPPGPPPPNHPDW